MVAVCSNRPLVMQECGKGTVTWQLIEEDIDSPESCTLCGCSMLIDLLFYGCEIGLLQDGRHFSMYVPLGGDVLCLL
jgi:hypothetical protein